MPVTSLGNLPVLRMVLSWKVASELGGTEVPVLGFSESVSLRRYVGLGDSKIHPRIYCRSYWLLWGRRL